MTSTNDGKDVKSNQTSGHKSKSYYIELYTSLEKALSGDGTLEERTAHVCEAWRRVYCLYQHSATSTHPHLLSWLQRHTANTVLQSKWAKSKNEQARLTNAIDSLVAEATAAAANREQHPWEKLLLQRAAWFRKAVENPWDNPVLKSLINPHSEPVTDEQVLEWLISEHGIVLVTRLQRMAHAGNCDDLALLLASAVMDRARAAVPRRADDKADERVEEEDPSSFVAVLEREASFTSEEWDLLTDIELVLLLKTDKRPRCIELAKLTPLRHGYKMVERLRKRLEMSPRDKKLWKHAKEAATLVAQMVIARCMVVPSCAGAAREALYWCARALARLVADSALRSVCTKLAAPAATARHLHTFCAALIGECKELKTEVIMKPFICELYVRAITTGIYELEKLKLIPEKEAEARLYEQTLAGWFMQLGGRLTDSARLRAECCLTAFSVHPAEKHYQRVANTPQPPGLQTILEPTPEATSEYGSWANDSRTQSNLVKTSETLQLKQSQQHQANVLSTAILTEGEALGLETELCQDLAVILSGPRVKTLSWDMDREVLLENCRVYMDKTQGGTRAVTTELKYLNLDPKAYRHLPEEGDDEGDLYYGIEKGYEHEVIFEEPEDIWQNGFLDPEQTESANDSEVERQIRKMSKAASSEDDEDPLSNIAEAKREKKKLAKEKSKKRSKKSHKRDESKDGRRERRKDKDKKTKKERKNKSEQPTPGSLTSLLGMKVSQMSAQVQDGEKRIRKKKERRRVPKTMFSYVSVTDGDYDSQVKSQVSEQHDPNVLVDGVFSMDELQSPEKIIDSPKPIDNTKTSLNNATVQSPVIKDIKTRPMSSSHSTASDSDVSKAKSPYLTPNQLGPRHVVGSKVKSSITKLLQFRRKKSQVRDVPRPPPSRTPTNPTHSLVGMKIYKPEDASKAYLNQTQSKQLGAISKEVCNLLNETSSSVNHRTAPETANRLQNLNLCNVQKYQQQYGNPHHIPQTYNENKKHSKYTQHSPIRPAHQVSTQLPSSVIHTNYSSPIKTPEHMRTHILNLSPPKQTMAYQPLHKSMQNISTEAKYDPPKKPQLINDPNYFSQQHAKTNPSPLSPMIISNTCIKPPSQTPIQHNSATVKDNTMKSPQTYSNVHGTNTPRGPAQARSQITDSKMDGMKYVPKPLSRSMQNISEVPGRFDAIKTHIPTPNMLHGQAAKSYSVKSQNDTSNTSQTLYNSNNTTASRCLPIQHRERADKAPHKPNINFEEYLKELVKSISESNGHDKNRTVALNKNVNVTPVPTATAKRVDSVTPQCAKQLIQQKKTENAPNTFSRRSYMHKNKQSENKLSLTDSITLELNRTMMDHKMSKAKCMKNEVTISRVGPNKQYPGNVTRKLEQPCSRLQRVCPVLSSMLDASGTPKIQTVSNTANSNMPGNQPNREDADLLLLLRNQTVLKQNVSTIEALASDTSGHALNNSQINVGVSSAHQGLVGTKVKNINILDTPINSEPEEDKLEWKRVMDAIIAQKTEPLGPNALDLVLKKQYSRNSQSSSRAQSSDKHRVSGQSSSHNKPVDPKKREHYCSKASSSRKPSTEKHSEIPKKPREPEMIKKTTTEILNKHFSSTIPKDVPQALVTQNSDYDNLDELMDDDLRRELGEISSDEDAYSASDAALLKGKTQSNIPKTVTNVYKAANISKEKPHIVYPKTITKNANVADCNRRFAVNTCPTTGYPNVINNPSHPAHIANKPTAVNAEMRQHTATSTIITNQVAQDTANNIVTSHIGVDQFMTNVLPANVIIASVSQPPVVVISQDLVYDPYPTIRIHESQMKTELCTVNKNMYALSATPNIAVYQTTQYAAPLINPVIIGNAMTTTNVSNATAMGNDHDTPDRTKDINNEDQDSISLEDAIRLTDNGNQQNSTKCLEATISHSDDRRLTPEISTNLDFNMNRNCERKVLSQVQEKHLNDNVDKDSYLKRSPDDDIPLKSDEDRIKLKRQYLMNRKISHAVEHPIIPLTYTPLTRKVNLDKQLQRETPKNGIAKPNRISIPNCTTDIEKSIVISTSEKNPQSEANNENIESTDQASSVKENQKSCRRIWLRSSNKIRNNKVSPAKCSRVPLKRNKIELKVRYKEALEKNANVESEKKDSVTNLKRVSNRILNKVKVSKPATNKPPGQEALLQNVADNGELIDFEEALSGTIVLKSPTTMSGTENTTKEPKCNSTEVEREESGAAVDKQHTILNSIEDTKVTTISNKITDIRLEPTVVIEKLNGKLCDQLIVKRSSVKTPVNKAKVIAIKNNRPVLRNKSIIKKCIPTEATSNKITIKEAPKNTVSAAAVPDDTNKSKPVVIIGQKMGKATSTSTQLVSVETNKHVDQKVIERTSAVDAPIPLDDNNKLKPALDVQNESCKLNLPAAEQKETELITVASSQPVIETTVKDDLKVNEAAATSSAIDFEKTNKKPITVEDQKVITQTRSNRLPAVEDETNTLTTAVDNRDVVDQTSSVELPLDLNESNKSKPRAMGDQELMKHTESTPESSTTEQKIHVNDSPDCIKATELKVKNQSQTSKTNSTLSSDRENTSRAVEKKPSTVINKATCILSPQASDHVINHVPLTQKNSEEVIDLSETDNVQSTTEVLKYNSNYDITNMDQQIDKSLLCQENIEVLSDGAAPKSDVGQEKQDLKQIINLREPLNVISKPENTDDNLNKTEGLKALAAENAKRPHLTSVPNNVKQTYIKDDIKIVELPLVNSKDPSKKLVRLTLPNGKIFRATIHGKIQGDIDHLFADPRMRAMLAGGMSEGKKYTVNYNQVCKANKTQIKNLNVKEAEHRSYTEQMVGTPIDTVNLISDDEDEVPTVPTRRFTTEFGKYITNADAETCIMHQTKFNQKCEVKMYREDIFKSNKRKPKRNMPSRTTLLTRNKSKLLSTASAPVVSSTTTNLKPEVVSNLDISTHPQETPGLTLEQDKITEVDTNVIEIDDSSNDGIDIPTPKNGDDINIEPVKKLVELKSLLLSDLGVDKNITFPLPKEKAVNNLKSALLQDLGLVTAEDPVIDITVDDEKQDETLTESRKQNECLDNNPVDDITQNKEKKVEKLIAIQTQNNTCFVDDAVVKNEERDKNTLTGQQEQDSLLKCVVKLVNCDNLVKNYERMKTMKKCYVKLERLNNSISKVAIASLNEKTNYEVTDEMEETDEMNLDTNDFINFDVEEPSGSPQLSRCPSLSILNNWDDDSQPLEIPYSTSPVMEVYDTIAQLRNKLKMELVRHPEKLLSWTCDSEWRMTKLGYNIEERLLRSSNIPSLVIKIVPDNDNVLVGGTENLVIKFDASKLGTITLKFLDDNPDILYRLESMRNLRRILSTKTSPNKLKRKTEEVASDTVARKILKLGTLALNSLKSSLKVRDGISFSNIEENLTAQPDASSINNESSNRVIVECMPKDLTTTLTENIEDDKQMDDSMITSDIENSEPEETDLIAECENNVCSSQYIDAGPVYEDSHTDLVESMLIAESNMTDDSSEEKCKEDTQDSQERHPEKNTTDRCGNKEYSYPTVEVTVVHEEANSSEETIPVIDSTTSPTCNRAEEEECKEGILDSIIKPDESKTGLDAQCENYEECVSPDISVALIDKEANANAEETNEGEPEKNSTNEYAQFKNNEECLTSPISDPLPNEDTTAYPEETVQTVDSDMRQTDLKTEEINYPLVNEGANAYAEDTVQSVDSNTGIIVEKIEENNEGEPEKNTTNEYAQFKNNEECLTSPISDPLPNEDTTAYPEETVQTVDSDMRQTDLKTEEINCKLVNEGANAYAEDIVQSVDSNTGLIVEKIEENNEVEPEKNTTNEFAQFESNEECLTSSISDPLFNEATTAYPEEIIHSDMSQADLKTEEINYPLVNEGANAYAEDTVQNVDSDTGLIVEKIEENNEGEPEKNTTNEYAQFENNEECLTSPISDSFLNQDTTAYPEETVQTVDSDMSQTDLKTEEINYPLVNEGANAYAEDTVQDFDSDTSPTDRKTEEINVLLVNDDTIAYSEETVQTVDSEMCPTDHKTDEKYDQNTNYTGNFIDDICKEQSIPAHREPDLVSEECEAIKIEENENTPVNTNLSVEKSISYLRSESSCDKNVTEDIHTGPSQFPLSNSAESGDTERQISVKVSDEHTSTEVPHIVNSDRSDEIPIDEISNDVYEVEVLDTNIDDGVETLLEKSQEPVTLPNSDSSEVNHQDSAIKSPDFIDSKNIAFNYHDYTKQPKKKEDVTSSTINCRPDCEVNNCEVDKDQLTECATETHNNTALKVDSKENSCRKNTHTNHTDVNTSENCPLKSNPELKYELIQEDDLLTVEITTENDKDDYESKTVFIDPNDAEEETVASFSSGQADDNIDIKGFEFEDMYVFPLNQSASNSNNNSNDSLGQESNSESVNDTTQNDLHDIDFHVIEPEITYSRKRKIDMRDIRVPSKKYRKSKNIDCSKQTVISMAELAYGKEYKRLLEYCSSVKFSYTRPFHKECVEVDDLMTNWPINCVSCDVPGDISEEHLFVDLHDISSYQPDPMTQTFVEEINYEYDRTDAAPENPSSVASEVNFNMGFGEGSGRVIQILKKGVSNISAATLSDVKQSQPVFKSVDLDDCNYVRTKKDDQIKKIRQYVNFIELRDKVRTFFKKSSDELKSDWLQKAKDTDLESKCNYRLSGEEFPFDLCSLDYVTPHPTNVIVQVVQVGQLPVSAAAQNPVTCDPRVTQVSDASPSQCSVDNSPNDDSQSEIKTEYTELTTADLTLPLQGYAQQNQANLASNDSNMEFEQTISLEMEIKEEESPEIKKEIPDIKEEKSNSSDTDLHTVTNAAPENMDYSFETNTGKSDANSVAYDSSEQNSSETFSQQRQQNGTTEKTDQIAHAMNAAGINTTPETLTNTRAHALVNILSQKIRQGSVNTTQTTTNTYSKTTSINAMALQQALAQILPPPLNQTGSSENNQAQSTPVGPQVLHIVQGKNASGNQITLVDNSQQSVISTPNTTQVLHIVQNKNANSGQASNGTLTSQGNSFSGLSLVDAGLQQGGNQLLHIVNTGNQKNTSPGQLLKRVNLLTNLTNVQGSNEQKMVQFVCKSADGKAIQLNAPHQRSMVLRLQPIETPNVQTSPAKPAESQEPSPSPTGSASSKESASQQEIKSRSIYEENYAKFIQNSSSKTPGLEKSTSLPKFNQAFGKPVFQEGQKQGEAANNNSHLPPVNTNTENTDCSERDNAINLEHIGQISSPPLLLRKQPVVTSASQPNIVQQIKQTIAPMNIQTMHGGVIYTRQIPVNIGGGQTINLITVPSTELINDDSSKSQAHNNQGEIEPSIIKIVPQSQTTSNNDSSQEESNHASGSNENAQTQPQPVLTQMRIKLPMLSKAPQMVPGARVVRPSFFQIQRNVIGGNNQPVYQQLVLTAAPPLGQQTIRLPQAQASRPVKAPSESQSSSSESQMSTSTLEQLREFDMVLEQVKERSTVQPSTNSNNNAFKIHTTSSDTTDGNGSSNCSTESTPQVLYSIGNNQSLNVAYVNRKTSVTTPTTSNYVRSPDSSGIADSPTSSTHVQIPHTVTTDSSPTEMSQSKPAKVGSKSKSRPKSTSNPPNTLKLNSVPPKTSSQKPLEDEQTTQRILYILAEYKEQVENSPDKDKPAPRRRSNPPSNPGSSKRKKSSSSRRSGTRDMSPIHGEDTCRTMGSEDSSCGTSQGDCTESCLDSHSPQDSPRKVARKITFDQDLTVTQPRPQPQRNVIVADGQTITVARGTTGKPATAVLMPANYILPVSMMKGGQQIAIVTNRGPKLLTVGGEGGATNALLLQRLIGPAGLKPVLTRPGVRHVRLPTAALHNLQAFNLTTAATVQPPDSTASLTPGPTPPELVDTRASSSPWTDRDEVKPERGSSPEGSEPWNLPSSADAHEYTYEETVRTDNMDRTVLVVQKKDGSHRQHRLSHVSAAALRHKYAILEHELRLQKSLSEECEDLGVDSPSASELFPEAELLFAASPAHDHNQEHHSHTPQPLQSSIPQPDMDDQIATDHLIPREIDVSLGLGDVGIVAVSEDGSATIALDQEEFARSHPNTTFHSEPTEGEVQPFTITGLKGRHITSTIFHSNAPATVLMTAPQATVISQAPDHSVKYQIENMINSMPSSHNNDINLSSVLVKDDGLTRFDNILTDSRELHLTNTTSAIVHSSGNATQVIRRVCYEDDKRERDARYLIDEPDNLIAGDDAKMIAEDSSRDATLESMDVDDDRSSPERHAELFWESNSASERSESRRPLDFSSDSDKCCKSPSFDETNSTDSSGVGTHLRLDSVIKEARTRDRSGSLDGSSADDGAPPLRTYPAKRLYQPLASGPERSLSGKTRAGERSPDPEEGVRRRASGRGVVKRGCHCCNGEPAPPRPKKPRQRKPTLDFHATN